MKLKEKLPVSYLLFTNRGRISRGVYWTASLFIWTSFYLLFNLLALIGNAATWFIYPLLFWTIIATATKRLHDSNKNTHWLWLVLIPVFGPLVLIYLLGFRRGSKQNNKYGIKPGTAPDYFINSDTQGTANEKIVNDVTQLNPIAVAHIAAPETISQLQELVKNTKTPISTGGGRFSMGGQTASPGSTHIDMRKLNKVHAFSKTEKTITVEAGIRWCDIQRHIDPHNLSVKIMQTYANFTVGGALSVNAHGRYIGAGPLILSVINIEVILATGELIKASPIENNEIFFACVGCYNALGIIVRVELQLVDNVALKRAHKIMPVTDYKNFFFENIRNNKEVVFHNGDVYTPRYKNVRAVSWVKTTEKPTHKTPLMPLAASYPVERYFIGAFSKSDFGKWRRQHIIDPLLYLGRKVHMRNYEAGYDVAELEPRSRKKNTYVLQEYFIPVARFDEFATMMTEIFKRDEVNVINVSVRHAHADTGSLLAWAREEVFAFVIYYKQDTDKIARCRVGVWTRRLIDAATSLGGAYYLPYQPHATAEQFHKAYPGAKKLFALKSKLDPDYKFRNVLWDTYYQPFINQSNGSDI